LHSIQRRDKRAKQSERGKEWSKNRRYSEGERKEDADGWNKWLDGRIDERIDIGANKRE